MDVVTLNLAQLIRDAQEATSCLAEALPDPYATTSVIDLLRSLEDALETCLVLNSQLERDPLERRQVDQVVKHLLMAHARASLALSRPPVAST